MGEGGERTARVSTPSADAGRATIMDGSVPASGATGPRRAATTAAAAASPPSACAALIAFISSSYSTVKWEGGVVGRQAGRIEEGEGEPIGNTSSTAPGLTVANLPLILGRDSACTFLASYRMVLPNVRLRLRSR